MLVRRSEILKQDKFFSSMFVDNVCIFVVLSESAMTEKMNKTDKKFAPYLVANLLIGVENVISWLTKKKICNRVGGRLTYYPYLKKEGIQELHIVDTSDFYLKRAITASKIKRVWYESPLFILPKEESIWQGPHFLDTVPKESVL